MKKFEGNINGKVYTNEEEFNKALSDCDRTENMSVSYNYTFIPDENVISKQTRDNIDKKNNNVVLEADYVKTVDNKHDVELDSNLVNKLKNASNKSDIKRDICKKIDDFNNKISDNLLYINELKMDYKKLDEKIKFINEQIKTLEDANNNYYLNKEYYINIKKFIDTLSKDIVEIKKYSDNCKNKQVDVSLSDISEMTPRELLDYFCTLMMTK